MSLYFSRLFYQIIAQRNYSVPWAEIIFPRFKRNSVETNEILRGLVGISPLEKTALWILMMSTYFSEPRQILTFPESENW